jgi:putative endonuclease
VPRPPSQLRRGRFLSRRTVGTWGEDLALRYLTEQGYELVERNYRTRFGELDLVVRHQSTLVFVEVKLRRGTGYGNPLDAVTPRKQRAIRALAERYLADRAPDFDAVRFDVVGILLEGDTPRISHVRDAF